MDVLESLATPFFTLVDFALDAPGLAAVLGAGLATAIAFLLLAA